jgi:hypothetical protein
MRRRYECPTEELRDQAPSENPSSADHAEAPEPSSSTPETDARANAGAPTAEEAAKSDRPRRICRTIEEIRQAGYEAAAQHCPLTPAEKTSLLALIAPYRDQLIDPERRAS